MKLVSNRLGWWIARLGAVFALAVVGCREDRDSSGGLYGGGDGDGGDDGADGGSADDGGDGGDDGSDDGGDSDGTGPKFDVGTGGSDGPGDSDDPCECPEPSPKHYIWVANSQESTVSKINTITVQEEGRYATHPGMGDPSRTSVNISGRAMAVANRNGGVTKVWANVEDCVDASGDGTIQTSTGASDVLAWGADECVAWHTPLDYTSNRPVAWTCFGGGEKVWTSGKTDLGGLPAADPIDVLLLDGDTGAIEQTIVVDGFGGLNFGGYGGAVDGDGNFFVIPNGIAGGIGGGNVMARIDAVTFTCELVPIPAEIISYGITVDGDGNPWVTSYGSVGAARYNVALGTWDTVAGFKSQSGIMQDRDGRLWVGSGTQGGADPPIGVYWIDPGSLALSAIIPISGEEIKGISVDPEGFVWAVNKAPGVAYKIDPDTQQMDSYDNLTSPYTYSDMTGWAIQNANDCKPPPQG